MLTAEIHSDWSPLVSILCGWSQNSPMVRYFEHHLLCVTSVPELGLSQGAKVSTFRGLPIVASFGLDTLPQAQCFLMNSTSSFN